MDVQITYSNSSESFKVYLLRLWKHREMLFFFVWRLFRLRLKQNYLGILWAIVRPLVPAVVFAGVTHGIFVLVSAQINFFSLMLFYLFWFLAQSIMSDVSESLHYDVAIVRKIAFPKIFIPLAHALFRSIDFLIVSLLVYTAWCISSMPVTAHFGRYIFAALCVVFSVTGVSLILTRLNIERKDIGQIIPFITQIMLVSLPIGLGVSLLPTWIGKIMLGNPVVSAVYLARGEFTLTASTVFCVMAALLFSIGVYVFYRVEYLIPEKI